MKWLKRVVAKLRSLFAVWKPVRVTSTIRTPAHTAHVSTLDNSVWRRNLSEPNAKLAKFLRAVFLYSKVLRTWDNNRLILKTAVSMDYVETALQLGIATRFGYIKIPLPENAISIVWDMKNEADIADFVHEYIPDAGLLAHACALRVKNGGDNA